VDAERNTQTPAFDHSRLAAALSRAAGKTYPATELPFRSIEFVNGGFGIAFNVEGTHWVCAALSIHTCKKIPKPTGHKRGLSPDGKWQAKVKNYNLYLRNTSTGNQIRLTSDGRKDWVYATPLPDSRLMIEQRTENVKQPPAVFWSHDSKRLVTYRIDSRKAGRFFITQHAPPFQLRPVSYSVVYPLPGEKLSTAAPIIFDVSTRKQTSVQMEPIEIFFQDGPSFRWLHDNVHFVFDYTARGYKCAEIREVDAATGKVRTLVQEKSDTFVDPDASYQRWLKNDSEVIVSSERDGWNHLYLYNPRTASLENRLTQGEWVVRSIEHIDDKNRQVYFLAGGREPGEDPYLTHLYRVRLDGTSLELLTPEPANHTVDFSPTGDYFIDTYSRPDLPTVSVLRRADGKQVRTLERAQADKLLDTGFQYPEPFRGKGRDGQTDIYGIIWRPSHLDASRKYPIVEQIYTGPQGFFVPKNFSAFRNSAQAIAELGFIVVQVDGMGTAGRSKAFHDHCYKNMGDSGLPDHIALIKQMAEKYPYMDLNRVGVYGVSAGGYDATRAMLTHPEFYKVAVATSGVQDNRLDKAWWNELWMSYPVGPWYEEQSNVTLAKNLTGHLLLIHGDVDDNVNVSNTLRLADALIKANRNFDMYIVPNMFHGDGDITWVSRKRWDYFVQNLLGVTPPLDFAIQVPPKEEIDAEQIRRKRHENQ
jgi:dipeptidyl aminopeptidase/acylaminoacyl peptidase